MLVGAATTKASCQMLSGLIAYLALYRVPRFTRKTRITGKTKEYIELWTILCTRDQTNLRFTRDFTAAIKAQACQFWVREATEQFMIY